MSPQQKSSLKSDVAGSSKSPSIRYEPCIDGWRACAAGMVLIAHFFPHRLPPNNWFQLGYSGVVIFFIISGYLISLILFQAKERVAAARLTKWAALRRFYVRRVLRISPIYYTTIAALCLIGAQGLRADLWWHLTYTTNFGQVFWHAAYKYVGHFWTLAVEEQFYLLWPLVVLSVSEKFLGAAIRWLIAISAVFCTAGAALSGSFDLLTKLPIGGSSLALAFGALIAYDRNYECGLGRRITRISFWLGLPVFGISQILRWSFGGESARDILSYKLLYVWSVTLFFGWLFLKSLVHDSMLNRFLRGRVLCYVGRISYGLYVYSLVLDPYFYSIWARLGFHLSLGRIEEGCLKTATSIVVAAASWHFFEKPILSLKDRLAPDPGSSSGSRSSDQKGDT